MTQEDQREIYIRRLLPIVKKINGEQIAFNPNKIIEYLINDFKVDETVAVEIAVKITRKLISEKTDIIYTSLIEEFIINELAERGIIEFTLPLVKTSRGVDLPFNSNKIKKSLIKEVNMNDEIAHTIAKEIEKQIRKIDIHFLSAPLLREIACWILTQMGYEKERKRYTRCGMPPFDIEKLLPRSSKIQNQLRILIQMGYFKNGSIGKIIYDVLKDYYALSDPFFIIIWKIHTLLKKVKATFKQSTETLIAFFNDDFYKFILKMDKLNKRFKRVVKIYYSNVKCNQ